MWKTSQVQTSTASVLPETSRPTPAIYAVEPNTHSALLAREQSVIGAGLVMVGEISGTESLKSLFIEGTVEGKINLPGTLVTVGSGGRVNAEVVARRIVISGKIVGNVAASDRLEIRAGGSLTGDASACRINVADGAFIQGSILVTSDAEELAAALHMAPTEIKAHKTVDFRSEIHVPIMVPALRSA